jgi:hypothetical protein
VRDLIEELKESKKNWWEDEPEFVDHWKGVLTKLSTGLDFTDPEDRVTFRLKVDHKTQNMKVAAMRGLAKALGAKRVGTGRGDAWRAIADAWMKGKY